MRVAAYVRVSTDEQADKGNSIFEQQERLTAYCKAMNWNAPEFYIDEGYSAKNLKRPAITKLLNDIKTTQYDVIVSTKLDRVCRNLSELLQIVRMFEDFNCRLVSASESFDTSTAAGRMVLQLLGMFAEFERERISERVRDNMISLAKNTNKALGKACFGYRVENGKLVIDEDEARHVRWMFDTAEQGVGFTTIAKRLNQIGVLTRNGKMWEHTSVKRFMVQETVTGTKVFNQRDFRSGTGKLRDKKEWIVKHDNHPAIISREQYDRVMALFEKRKPARIAAESETYLLSGILYCGFCGGRMKGHTVRQPYKTYHNYNCRNYIDSRSCISHRVDRGEIESFVLTQIEQIANCSLDDIELRFTKNKKTVDDVSNLKQQIERLNVRMQKQIQAFELDLIAPEDLKRAKNRIVNEREQLQERLSQLESQSLPAETIKQVAFASADSFVSGDRAKLKTTLPALIDKIVVRHRTVDIIWMF